MELFFCMEFLILFIFWWKIFKAPLGNNHLFVSLLLFPLPFLFGLSQIYLISHCFTLEQLRLYSQLVYSYSIINSLLLIPQWYKLMWLSLLHLSPKQLTDIQKLLLAILLAAVMISAIVFFFALYYLWIDHLSGYTQGLRSALMNYQPILLDFQTAFYFSFVVYFTLGFGDLVPYGPSFHLLVFLECLIALINTGVIVIYVYNFLFTRAHDNSFKGKNQ